MPDLDIDQSRLDAAAVHLQSAGENVLGVCAAISVVGSPSVEAALSDVETIVRTAIDALAEVATTLSADVKSVVSTFDETDRNMGEGVDTATRNTGALQTPTGSGDGGAP